MEKSISKQDIENMIELQHKLIEKAVIAEADDTVMKSLKDGLITLKKMLDGAKNAK